jgi:competence protein ComEC
LRTDQTGAVVIQTGGDVLDIQTARSMRPRYWSSAHEVQALATATDANDALP